MAGGLLKIRLGACRYKIFLWELVRFRVHPKQDRCHESEWRDSRNVSGRSGEPYLLDELTGVI